MDKKQFIENLKEVKIVRSIKGKLYHSIEVSEDKVYFIRSHKEKSENLSLDELFEFYTKEHKNKINTTVAKKYITKRAQSPAVAILIKMMEN